MDMVNPKLEDSYEKLWLKGLLIYAFLGFVVGGAWQIGFISIVFIVIGFYLISEARAWVFTMFFMYYGVATIGMVPVAAEYFSVNYVLSFALWFFVTVVSASIWAIFWHPVAKWRLLLVIPALGLCSVVPGWVHPLAGAGFLFPGLGWFGLLLTVGLAVMWMKYYNATFWLFLGLVLIATFFYKPMPTDWDEFDTSFGPYKQSDHITSYMRSNDVFESLKATGSRKVLLSEGVAGLALSNTLDRWINETDAQVVFGASRTAPNGKLDNLLVEVNDGFAQTVYKQRLPMPLGMWPHEYNAYPKGQAVFELSTGERASAAICYEGFVAWSFLQSALHKPDLFFVSANLWFSNGASLRKILEANARGWTQLFDIPLVIAVNR